MPKRERTVLEIAQSKPMRAEHFEQAFLVQRLALLESRWPELSLGYAIPNGGLRSKAQAGKLKAEGVRPSVPDYCLPVPRWPFHGLYVEMKAIGKYAGPEQRKFQARLIEQGYAVVECQGDEAAERIVVNYLKLNQWEEAKDVTTKRAMREWLAAAVAGGQGRAIVRWPVLGEGP